jgi:hypothetical protein
MAHLLLQRDRPGQNTSILLALTEPGYISLAAAFKRLAVRGAASVTICAVSKLSLVGWSR